MKKMLMIASVPSMIGQFNMNNIQILINLGFEVEVACDWKDRSVWTDEKVNDLKEKLNALDVIYHQIDYSRSPFSIGCHIKSYKQTLKLLRESSYEFVHCHTPIASAIARLACKKTNTKCIYTAHGFHFYKGAPIKNWIIFYPIEKWLSKYTDVLITINMEDYNRAKSKFNMKRLEYVHGVGIDTEAFYHSVVDRNKKREELGIKKDDILILSIGELSKRKNHEIVIKALNKLKNINNFYKVHYYVCGNGELKGYLEKLIKDFELCDNVKLLGFRTDIIELCKASDLFVFPSFQEGLPVALMESIACELGCVCSDIRGNIDLVKYKDNLFNPKDVNGLANVLKKLLIKKNNIQLEVLKENLEESIKNNYEGLLNFDLSHVKRKMTVLYQKIN
jgi:glycosyltransferase involved in cell wall biosynthesis